jgi:ABC-type sugar transport system ATPase subunit
MASVSYDSVSKYFGKTAALEEFSLGINDGEFVVLVGPSGSGKTTALRLLAGLESVSSGTIEIADRVVTDIAPHDRDIAMVFQSYALYPHMTVYRNLAYGMRIRKLPRDQIDARVRRTAEMLGLGQLLERKPAQLSGGQRQRVALGRALVREPRVFLMDEPLSNLDAKLRVQTRGDIWALQRRLGTTTVYVTHDQVEALTMGDRIVVMSDGKVEQVGNPEAVYEAPANLFVAGFIGSPAMSFGEFATSTQNGTATLTNRELRIDVTPPHELPAVVTLGIRPEHAGLWREGAGMLGPFVGKAQYVESLGRETFVGVRVSDDVQLVVRVDGRMYITLGEEITFGLSPGSLYLFDTETGQAIGRC